MRQLRGRDGGMDTELVKAPKLNGLVNPVVLASLKLAILYYVNHWNHDLEHAPNLGVDRIRGTEQHRDLFHGFPVEGNLELISGQMRGSDPEVAAELPVVSFEVALPSVGNLEMLLNNHIPVIAVLGFLEQDLETVSGF
jgi:hypothetical protein